MKALFLIMIYLMIWGLGMIGFAALLPYLVEKITNRIEPILVYAGAFLLSTFNLYYWIFINLKL